MSDESNALLALQNAWTGAVAASDRVRELAPSVTGLPAGAPLSDLDLDTYHLASAAHALAAQSLRGLVEELQRKKAKG